MYYLDSLRVHSNSYRPSEFKVKAPIGNSNDSRQGRGRVGGRGRGGRGQLDDRRKRQKTD